MSDLHDVIEQAIDDVDLPLEEPSLDTAADTDLPDAAPEPTTTDSTEAPATDGHNAPEPVEAKPEESSSSVEVQSPAARQGETTAKDDFEKRFGIPQNSASGRENRIPYSRVKKITEKAIKEEAARVTGEYTPKVAQFESQIKEYQTKVSDYEGRLTKVAEFEHIMQTDIPRFLGMLATIPGYSQFLSPLFNQEPQQQEAPAPAPDPNADMPQPDQELSDGSRVYSMEGLAKLNAWNRAQARKEALQDVEKGYGPMLQEWQQYRRIQEVMPKVQAQIDEARKWPQFNENEQDIVKALQADQRLTLEAAYNKVVVPRLVQAKDTEVSAAKADTDKLRQEIRAQLLKELQSAPRATSTQSGTAKPVPATRTGGTRSLESVIEEAIQGIK